MLKVFLVGLLMAGFLASASGAQEEVPVKDSFDGPELRGWKGLRPCWKLVKNEKGGSRLEVGGESEREIAATRIQHIIRGKDWANYLVGVTVQKVKGNWVGLVVRKSALGLYEVFFQKSGGIIVRRQPGSVVLSVTQGKYNDGRPHRLEVAAVGPHLRVFADGQLQTTVTDGTSAHGPSGLMCHFVHAFFGDYVQTRAVPLEKGLFVLPSSDFPAWHFPKNRPAVLVFDVWNASTAARQVELGIFDTALKPNTEPRLLASQKIAPGRNVLSLVRIPLPLLNEGLHLVRVQLSATGKTVSDEEFPLAVWDIPPPDETVRDPFFPIGVYDKYALGGDTGKRLTYLHAICRDLREHGLNTLLTGGVIRKPTLRALDICRRYGIRIVLRVNQLPPAPVLRHPSVICCMFGDEPKLSGLERYRQRTDEVQAAYPNLAVVSCLVGESCATGQPNDPLPIWWALKPRRRLVRFYPFRKRNYDLLRPPEYKHMTRFTSAMKSFGLMFDSPWWYVAQTFGGNVTKDGPDPYWRNPTGAELRASIHVALAYGASGILCYSYQTERGNRPALVSQKTLGTNDDKYAALADITRVIARHKQLLSALKFGGYEVRSSNSEILAVPLSDKETNRFAYVINLNTRKATTTRLDFVRMEPVKLEGVFPGGEFEVRKGAPYSSVTVRLGPGEAGLWAIIAP